MSPAPPPALPAFIWQLIDLWNAYVEPLLPAPLQALTSTLTPLLASGLSAAAQGDLVSLAAFLVTVYFSLRLLDYLRRSVIAWTLFLVKIAIVLGLINLAVYANRVGWDRAFQEAKWVFGWLWGILEKRVNGQGSNQTNWRGAAARDNPWQQVPVRARRTGGWA